MGRTKPNTRKSYDLKSPLKFSPKKLKEYIAVNDPRKLVINKRFTNAVREQLGFKTKIAILDSEFGVTTKMLRETGFAHRQIFAPNMNPYVCRTLKQLYDVHSQHTKMEEFITSFAGNALFQDGMTTIAGNETDDLYSLQVVDQFLKRLVVQGHTTGIVAVTIMSRCNKVEANIKVGGIKLRQKDILTNQMRAIISVNGFVFEDHDEFVDQYKKECCFGMWTVRYAPDEARPEQFYRMHRSKQIIGFPKGYKI